MADKPQTTTRQKCRMVFFSACWIFNAVLWGHVGYMKWLYQTPFPIHCEQGMTLAPKQSCYFSLADDPELNRELFLRGHQ